MINNITLAATYLCNLRCTYCDIWKKKDHAVLDIKHYNNLPRTKSVNITGGEPFLRKDIVDLIRILDKKADRIVFSSNGFATDLIKQRLNEMILAGIPKKKIGVRISIDGPEKLHDKLRGVPKSFNHAIETVKEVKKIISDIGIAFTMSKDNYPFLMDIYNLSKKLEVEFTTAVVHSSEMYFGENKGDVEYDIAKKMAKEFEKLKVIQLKSKSPKNWGRAYFTEGEIQFILKHKRMVPCDAGIKSFYIGPKGNVFPCNIINHKLGNLAEDSWGTIAKNGREFFQNTARKCNKCWMVCTAASPMKTHILSVGKWIISNKFRIRKS